MPAEFTKKHPDIPWKNIAGMRDKLIHHYFGLNLERVWEVLQKDLPELKAKIRRLLYSPEKIRRPPKCSPPGSPA